LLNVKVVAGATEIRVPMRYMFSKDRVGRDPSRKLLALLRLSGLAYLVSTQVCITA
jgi:hypothetical protein